MISPFRAHQFPLFLYCGHHTSSPPPPPPLTPQATGIFITTDAPRTQWHPTSTYQLPTGLLAATPVPVPMAAACYYCGGMPAVVYCRANAAGLCLQCDRHVHGANTISSSHALAPLGTACRRGGAARFLCSDCDSEERDGAARGGELEPPLHDRGTVEGYTGCPTRSELAAILSVHGCEKAAADGGGDDGWWPVWEEPQVLSLDDVIVPTISCHGLQPLLTSSPKVGRNTAKPVAVTVHRPKNKSMMVLVVCKNRTSPCEELNGEVLRQLAKSEAAAQVAVYVEAEPAGGDQLPPWASSEYGIDHGGFRALGTEVAYEAAASISVPSCEHGAPWIATDCTDPPDARDAEAAREQFPARSSAEPTLSSFVEISDIVCPSMSRSGSSSIDVVNGSRDHPSSMAVAPAQGQPKNGGYDIAYPDRSTVISRYKEKRKNRRFGKQIRYESRKARADSRLRINGRFAKSS